MGINPLDVETRCQRGEKCRLLEKARIYWRACRNRPVPLPRQRGAPQPAQRHASGKAAQSKQFVLRSFLRSDDAHLHSYMLRIFPCSLRPSTKRLSFKAIPIHTHTYTTMTDTSKWKLNHTMLRVKDPQRSIDYYKLLGMALIKKLPMPDAKFDNYFLGQ